MVSTEQVADLRETKYKDQEGTTYFFAIDRETVIDATHKGGMARFCCGGRERCRECTQLIFWPRSTKQSNGVRGG